MSLHRPLRRPARLAHAAALVLGLAATAPAVAWEYAFVAFPDEYTLDTGSAVVVDDQYLPAVRSQDRLGFCYAFQAAYVLENHRCLRGAADCRDDRPAQRLSTLDLSLHQHDAYGLFMQEGGDGLESVRRALSVAAGGDALPTEACVPYRQLTDAQPEAPLEDLLQLLAVRNDVLMDPESYAALAGNDPVALIEEEVAANYPAIVTWDGLRAAEAEAAEYQELLHPQVAAAKLLVPAGCAEPVALDNVESIAGVSLPGPEDPEEPWESYYDDVMGVITRVLGEQRVAGINVCMANVEGQVGTPDDCPEFMHAITVTGYGRFCNEEGCADALRILNSWGTDWQDQYRGGWVYAPALVEKLPVNRYTETMFFLTEAEPTAEAVDQAAPEDASHPEP